MNIKFNGYSSDNLTRIKNVLKIAIDQYELKKRDGTIGVKISVFKLRKLGFDEDEFLSILRLINSELYSFRIYNDISNFKDQDDPEPSVIFVINRHSINDLQEAYKAISVQQIFNFPEGELVGYTGQRKIIFFKVADGEPEIIDLSSALEEQKIFESLWNLRLRKPKEEYFTREEIKNTYNELHQKELDTFKLSHDISNLKKKASKKLLLKDRFVLKFDKSKNKWHFNLS